MNTTQPAVKRRTAVGSRFPKKPRKYGKSHNCAEFDPRIAQSMMANFFETALERIVSDTIVTVRIDEEGAHLVFIGEGFQFSLIYQEEAV